MIIDVVKVFLPSVLSFIVGIAITPLWTYYLYKYKLWKKVGGKKALDGTTATVFNSLHTEKETGTPRMGGVIAWASVCIVVALLWTLPYIFKIDAFIKLDLVSRNQTWIPLVTLLFGGFVGLIDDLLEIKKGAGGLSLKKRLLVVGALGLVWGWWFYTKLGVTSIGIPFSDDLFIGVGIIPLFALVMIGLYSGGVIDGIDGLAGGIFATMFTAYAGIAFFQNQINLAAFCATVAGGILAFLWFNIPPARFYMTETGSMALTMTLAVVAFMTDAIVKTNSTSVRGGYGLLVLPIIGLPLIATAASNILQILSKRFRKKKLLRIAPLHHHFEALGWPAYKVTMRYWIIGVVAAILGLTLAVVG